MLKKQFISFTFNKSNHAFCKEFYHSVVSQKREMNSSLNIEGHFDIIFWNSLIMIIYSTNNLKKYNLIDLDKQILVKTAIKKILNKSNDRFCTKKLIYINYQLKNLTINNKQ